MEYNTIELAISIQAPVQKVWRVFTDIAITKQMGGFYETDWKVGSSFGFVTVDGTRVTNGTLLELQPERLIKHNLYKSGGSHLTSVITYEFQDKNGTHC